MSRPPSPSKFVDLSQEHAEATRQIQNDQSQEDDQLRRAIAESKKDMPGQENGTINAGQQFGPAQRPYYPEAQWALAPIASSREVVDHPPPAKRRRIEGSPAFLRGPPESGYNAPLLSIYHSIPLAREALLFPSLKVYSYGHNSEWWAGTTDENTKSLSMQQAEPGGEDRRKYLAELQCLMAFLDNTTRAYGSVDALSDLRYFQYFNSQSEYIKVLETWQQAAMDENPDEPLTRVFTSSATRGPNDGAATETKDLFSVEGAITDARTQVEVLDKIVWSDSPNQPLDDIWIDQFGHVLTMKVHNENPGASELGLAPTEVWYLDRYMHELRETLWNMRQQCHQLSREQLRLGQARSRLAEMPGASPAASRVDIRKALEDARDAMPIASDDSLRTGDRLIDVSSNVEAAQLQSQINSLLTSITKKLKELSLRMSELESQKQQIMSDLTDPNHSSQPLRHKYVLQGVSTRPNVTYIRKLNHDLIGMDDDEEPHEIWQWWRTAWGEASNDQPGAPTTHIEDSQDTIDSSAPFSVRKVSAKDVLDAVENEYHTAILVYASDIAMQFRSTPLPASLRQFVEQDNHAFEDESSPQHVQQANRGRSWSNETNSTIMDDSNPFDDTAYPRQARDMTPMSTSTIRSLDGQPSPKRPRSSDDSVHDTNLMDMPPSYEDIHTEQQEMTEKKGNKIGFFAEQMMQQVDDNEQKG